MSDDAWAPWIDSLVVAKGGDYGGLFDQAGNPWGARPKGFIDQATVAAIVKSIKQGNLVDPKPMVCGFKPLQVQLEQDENITFNLIIDSESKEPKTMFHATLINSAVLVVGKKDPNKGQARNICEDAKKKFLEANCIP